MSAATILVVDYHREIIDFAKAALAGADFEVHTAACGEEGLGILEKHADVDLVISEVVMPAGKISGLEFVRGVKESFPYTAVMLMTGFTDQLLDPAIPLLEKPFVAAALVDRVQRVLTASRRQAEELRATRRILQRTFETNSALRPGIQAAIYASQCARRQSRRQRAEWLCARLREANAVIPTVLVAEDDMASRYAVCRFLSRAGLTVLEASSGAEALAVMRERGGRIDMLVTDLRMPGMDGLELAETVAGEYRQTSVVFITGEGVHLPHPVVRIPFEPEDLLGVMAEKLLSRMQAREAGKGRDAIHAASTAPDQP